MVNKKNHSVLDLNKLHRMTKESGNKKGKALGEDLTAEKESLAGESSSGWRRKESVDLEGGKRLSLPPPAAPRTFDQSEMLEMIQDSGLFIQAK